MKNLEDAVGDLTAARPKPRQHFLINQAFALFWTGQTVSTLGAQVTAFAVPLLAAITLHASSFQMGLLRAAEFAPFLVFTLPAGVWADLGIRRWLMIAANLVRGAFITVVPLAVFLGWMHLGVLYLAMFVMGSLKVVFEMAYQTYIPEIVERDRLVNANSKIMMSYALGQSTGPGLGGLMVELLGAPMAVLADASTYFLSAICLFKIKHQEVRVRHRRENILQQIADGFRYVGEERHIRSLLCLVTANNFFQNALMAILVLYATRDLSIRPGVFGMTVSVGGIGAVMGAFGAERLGRWFGPGPFVIWSTIMAALAAFCFPLVNYRKYCWSDRIGGCLFCAERRRIRSHGLRLDNSPNPDAEPNARKNEWRVSVHCHRDHAVWSIFWRLVGRNYGDKGHTDRLCLRAIDRIGIEPIFSPPGAKDAKRCRRKGARPAFRLPGELA